MGAITYSLDPALLRCLLAQGAFDVFVETGTYSGDTAALAQASFGEVYTVERDAGLAAAAVQRFAGASHVHVVPGDSPAALAHLQPQLRARKAIYWLDAHWQNAAGGTSDAARAAGEPLCPLLEELAAIGELNCHSVLLIDDARLFLAPPVAPHPLTGWPRLHDILLALQRLSPTHRSLVINDVIVFYPPAFEEGLYTFAHRHGVDWLAARTTMQEAAQLQAEVARLQLDNLEKEAVIQQIIRDRRLSPRYWLRSALYQTVWRGKLLHQYPARPLQLPPHYAQTAVRCAPPPMVSIVTPSYQQGAFLARTIESVLAQGYPQLEYVVQDGGSTDDTAAVLARYRDRLTHVAMEPDDGQADAINRGFAHTTGEIMAWLNSDDVLLPGAVAAVVNYFAAHPDVDVVYGHRILIDAQDNEIGRWVLPKHDPNILKWADYVPQETLFWRRRIWDKVGGGLDTRFQYALDWDLLLRFERAGARFARIPRFLGGFRVHPQQKTTAQLQEHGRPEVTRLLQESHGRLVGQSEVVGRVFWYVARAAWLDRLVAWGVVRH